MIHKGKFDVRKDIYRGKLINRGNHVGDDGVVAKTPLMMKKMMTKDLSFYFWMKVLLLFFIAQTTSSS